MKITQNKRNKKRMGIYLHNYAFHQPFQVIVDGTFAQACLTAQAHISDRLPAVVGGNVQVLTTKCLFAELHALGESLKGALQVLKTFQIRRCPHKKATDACSCVMDLLGATNEHHYVIATVDPKLMKRLAEKPGVPVVTVLGNRPVLLKASAATLRDVAQRQQQKMGTTLGREKALLSPGAAPGSSSSKKKPRGKKQPNPLSVKKKKTAPAVAAAAMPATPKTKEASAAPTGSKQPKRAPSASTMPAAGPEGQPPQKRSR